MWLLFAFIAVPLIEIALFIQVGGFIGLWPTLLIVLVTAVLGSWLVRSQGAREISRLQGAFSDLRDPTEPLANGAMILFAGALLLTPGFFTDAVGFGLLFPPFRAATFKWAKTKVKVQQFSMGEGPARPHRRDDRVIDGEFEDVSTKRPTHEPSKWTEH
ncbi:MAG: FxsA family protein [Yoonia sp.]